MAEHRPAEQHSHQAGRHQREGCAHRAQAAARPRPGRTFRKRRIAPGAGLGAARTPQRPPAGSSAGRPAAWRASRPRQHASRPLLPSTPRRSPCDQPATGTAPSWGFFTRVRPSRARAGTQCGEGAPRRSRRADTVSETGQRAVTCGFQRFWRLCRAPGVYQYRDARLAGEGLVAVEASHHGRRLTHRWGGVAGWRLKHSRCGAGA